jgi:hypothetical protein
LGAGASWGMWQVGTCGKAGLLGLSCCEKWKENFFTSINIFHISSEVENRSSEVENRSSEVKNQSSEAQMTALFQTTRNNITITKRNHNIPINKYIDRFCKNNMESSMMFHYVFITLHRFFSRVFKGLRLGWKIKLKKIIIRSP